MYSDIVQQKGKECIVKHDLSAAKQVKHKRLGHEVTFYKCDYG